MEGALVPYKPQAHHENASEQNDANQPQSPQFDLLSMLNDLDDHDEIDQQMVLAATQVEQTYKNATLMKRNTKPLQPQQTFQNCIFRNIGTLNIQKCAKMF